MLKIIAIIGQTGCGKTPLSINLAQKLGCSIINADCRLVYKELDIGSAKPTEVELATVKHHLVDIISLEDKYTVGNFVNDAKDIIQRAISANKTHIIVCGGTGLYTSSLLFNWQIPKVSPDISLRQYYNEMADNFGNEYLHNELRKIDCDSADKINVNDRFRIIRTIEICKYSGQKASKIRKIDKPLDNVVWIGLRCLNNLFLENRLTQRQNKLVELGLIDEVKYLYKKYGINNTLINTINYKEFIDYLDDKIDYDSAFNLSIKNNLKLAKKQLAWHKPNKLTNWFDIDKCDFAKIENDIDHLIL